MVRPRRREVVVSVLSRVWTRVVPAPAPSPRPHPAVCEVAAARAELPDDLVDLPLAEAVAALVGEVAALREALTPPRR